MTRRLALIALLLACAGSSALAAPVTAKPTLRLLAAEVPVLRGTGFKAQERVQVVIHAGRTTTTSVTATRLGTFSVRAGIPASDCAAVSAFARGDEGSRASFKRPPGQCAAQ
jgi:hypothetical protein